MRQKKIALVTGASSGMGRDFVRWIPKAFPEVEEIWAIARRKERLERLAEKCQVPLRAISMDLTEESSPRELAALLAEEKPDVRVLVHSAGFGVHGSFDSQPLEESLGMVRLNCLALTELTGICLPYVKKGGQIINLASAAAFLPQKGFAVYAASKSYVLSFSRALNRELKGRGIHVTAVCPGPVDTEFFKKDNCDVNKTFYKRLAMAQSRDVVRQALVDARRGRDVSVYGGLMKGFRLATKCIPHRAILFFTDFIL